MTAVNRAKERELWGKGWGGGPRMEADFSGGIELGQLEEKGQREPQREPYPSK